MAALEGDAAVQRDAWRQTTYIAHAMGAHDKPLSKVWREMGLMDAEAGRQKPKMSTEEQLRRADEVYQRLMEKDGDDSH